MYNPNKINMSFKKQLNKENIIKIYNQGLPKLINLIESQDELIFEDDFSEEVSDIVLNYDYMIIDKKISKLIYELN